MAIINATIEVRMTSSRLPGKPLMSVSGITMLELLIKRLSKSKFLKNIIVATTTNVEDDAIIELCESKGFLYYRGSEHNVLERVYNAAKNFDTDILVQITGDCPLIDPELVDHAIEMFLHVFPATRFVSNTGPNISMPWGFDVQVYKARELKIILGSEDLSVEDYEHVSSRFYKRSLNHLYKPIFLKYPYPLNRSELRVTLDYHEDFELIKAIILSLGPSEIVNVPMYDIIKWLDKNPAIRDSSIERHGNG